VLGPATMLQGVPNHRIRRSRVLAYTCTRSCSINHRRRVGLQLVSILAIPQRPVLTLRIAFRPLFMWCIRRFLQPIYAAALEEQSPKPHWPLIQETCPPGTFLHVAFPISTLQPTYLSQVIQPSDICYVRANCNFAAIDYADLAR
jgi:hypothetical protein